MKIKYSVVSSNNDKTYLDFWPYVSRAWKKMGIKPILMFIDKDRPEGIEQYGKVFYFDSMDDCSIVHQSQNIRFWAAKLLDDNFIISDMDMIPISESYFKDNSKNINGGIISYSSDIINYRWYRRNPQYPMCYLVGHPKNFVEILDMNENNHQEFLKKMCNPNNVISDQKYFYNKSEKNKHIKITHLKRGWVEERYATKRIDKVIWPEGNYNVYDYIDCHLPRPYSENKKICDELFKKMEIL